MIRKNLLHRFSVKVLTLLVIFTNGSCSYIRDYYGETCNSHAYLQRILSEHISSRFYKHAPVRMAVIPYSVPENLTTRSDQQPGLGDILAWQIQAEILQTHQVPIVEVFNRQDWPGKKAEFFTGNFGALDMAREAGYDMVLVGYVEMQKGLDSITAHTKVMDVDSGVTVYYGKSTAHTLKPKWDVIEDHLLITDREPSQIYHDKLVRTLAQCIGTAVTAEDLQEDLNK